MTDTLIARLRLIKGVCDEAADRIEALQSDQELSVQTMAQQYNTMLELRAEVENANRAHSILIAAWRNDDNTIQALHAEIEDWKKDQKANFEKIDALQSRLTALENCLGMLVSYTEACEGLLNCKPAGQVTNARALLASGAAPQQAEPVMTPKDQAIAYSQFLSDVTTAAGLLEHGKQSKALAKRIADYAFAARSEKQPAPQQAEPKEQT